MAACTAHAFPVKVTWDAEGAAALFYLTLRISWTDKLYSRVALIVVSIGDYTGELLRPFGQRYTLGYDVS